MNLQEELSTYKSEDVLAMTYWQKPFDFKSLKDWILVGVMAVPLVVLSAFGVMFLIDLSNLPK